MSQEKLARAFGLTFQQIQKYEKGVNRMGASRLQQAADLLGVAVPFFFEGADDGPYKDALSPSYIDDFVSREEGQRLARAFMRIQRPALRLVIVKLEGQQPQYRIKHFSEDFERVAFENELSAG